MARTLRLLTETKAPVRGAAKTVRTARALLGEIRLRAHVIGGEEEALAIAREIAADLKPRLAVRKNESKAPKHALELASRRGITALAVPKDYGGAELPTAALAEVLRIIATADPGVAQILIAQYTLGDVILTRGDKGQKDYFLPKILAGARVGNAMAEIGGKNAREFVTRLTRRPGGGYLLNGRKFYATGSYLSHWFPALAVDEEGKNVHPFVPRNAPGVAVLDDWKGFGQRNSLSGTATFDNVFLPEDHLFRSAPARSGTQGGQYAQVLHAAVDCGIARAALEAGIDYLRNHARPYPGTGFERAADDLHVIREIGQFTVLLHAAEALLARGAASVDRARARPDDPEAQTASFLAVADARAQADQAALAISSGIFSLLGASSSLEKWNLDRFWRNARTHTVHDPIRWKHHHIGNYYLNGVTPGASQAPKLGGRS
jgi:SfnB family sulfur acquisition oxidoreductase